MMMMRTTAHVTVSLRRLLLVQCRFIHTPRNILKLSERGLIHDFFPKEKGRELASHLESSPRCVYAGFDPSAESLHVGNLLILVALLHCQRAGHKVIALIGGATGRIGDPSGKSTERPMLRSEVVGKNAQGIRDNLETIFRNHAEQFGKDCKHDLSTFVKVVDNHDWYREVNLLDFLSTTGRYFRISKMLSRRSVKDRLDSGEGISLTEFMYQVFQAYDWLHLLRHHGCTVQIGGSDQYGNIHTGHELISRVVEKDESVYGITLPLVTSESGEKLGKTAGNPVWLSPSKTTCFDFYQYFLRIPDAEAESALKLFTFLPLGEIRDLVEKHSRSPEKRVMQRKLAEQVTLLVHGQTGLDLALKTTKVLYEGDAKTLGSLSLTEMRDVFAQAAYVRLLFDSGLCVLDFAMKIGCFASEKDAVRIISAGGFYVNETRHDNTEEVLVPGMHVLPNKTTLVRVGKRNYYIVEWTM